ncbi:hypothetical protein C8J57DRAFT_1312814 [Mycena rebaudengoi]|nr:hypothetical protein C8J57DRAFT_1312814 [Mycena rebaudengoi]
MEVKSNVSGEHALYLPPYDAIPRESAVDPYASPRNNVLISRNFGSVKKTRFIVNPNLNIPSSLLHPDPLHISIFPRSVQNLELSVTFGSIDVDVEVLPLSQQPPYRDSPAAARSSLFGAVLDKNKVHLKAVTSTGDITVRIDAQPTAPISLNAESWFGRVRIYVPRTMHGPLTITSGFRAPRLSREMQRVCTPLSEVDGTKRWFVGNLATWSANGERGDEVQVNVTFGSVWIGFVGEDEFEESKTTRRLSIFLWGIAQVLLLFLFFYYIVRGWFF